MINLLLRLSLSGSALILAVLALRALFLHRAPKRTFPILWGVALARLLLPVFLPSPLGLLPALPQVREVAPALQRLPVPAASAPVAPAAAALTPPAAPVPGGVVPALNGDLLLTLWLLGTAVLALFFLLNHLKCRRAYRTALPAQSPFVSRWLEGRRLRRRVRALTWDRLAAPITYGVLRPVVLLPASCLEDEGRLGYILAHELVHIRRFDVLYKWVLAGVLCLHWWNPLVWALYALAGRDLELSCDEAVLRSAPEDARKSYALALLGLEEKRGFLSAPFVNGFSKNALEERIRAIMSAKKTTRAGVALSLALILTATAVFAAAVPPKGTESPPPPAESGEEPISYDQLLFQYGVPMEELWASAVDITEASRNGAFMNQAFTYAGPPLVYRIGVSSDLPLLWIYLENPREEYWQYAVYTPNGRPYTMGGMVHPRRMIECPPGSYSYKDAPDPQCLYLVLYRLEDLDVDAGTYKLYGGPPVSGILSVRQELNWRTLCQYLAPEEYKNDPKNIWFTTQSNSRELDFTVTRDKPVFRVWARNTGEHDFRIMVKDADGTIMNTQMLRPGQEVPIEGAYGGDDPAVYTVMITSPISWYVEGVISYRTGDWSDEVWAGGAN